MLAVAGDPSSAAATKCPKTRLGRTRIRLAKRRVIGAPDAEPARLGGGITGDTFLGMDAVTIHELHDSGSEAVDRIKSGVTWR